MDSNLQKIYDYISKPYGITIDAALSVCERLCEHRSRRRGPNRTARREECFELWKRCIKDSEARGTPRKAVERRVADVCLLEAANALPFHLAGALSQLFHRFDTKGKQVITPQDLASVSARMGGPKAKKEIATLLESFQLTEEVSMASFLGILGVIAFGRAEEAMSNLCAIYDLVEPLSPEFDVVAVQLFEKLSINDLVSWEHVRDVRDALEVDPSVDLGDDVPDARHPAHGLSFNAFLSFFTAALVRTPNAAADVLRARYDLREPIIEDLHYLRDEVFMRVATARSPTQFLGLDFLMVARQLGCRKDVALSILTAASLGVDDATEFDVFSTLCAEAVRRSRRHNVNARAELAEYYAVPEVASTSVESVRSSPILLGTVAVCVVASVVLPQLRVP